MPRDLPAEVMRWVPFPGRSAAALLQRQRPRLQQWVPLLGQPLWQPGWCHQAAACWLRPEGGPPGGQPQGQRPCLQTQEGCLSVRVMWKALPVQKV